ncbi:MAG: hypothetical protein M3250_07280 [Thermoproteota archaeon]|nr:hypothetical protein [Thermoproteota archaeon]
MYKQLTIDTKSFTSTQNIAEDAMKHKKLTKVTSGYLEIENFVNSDTHTGYFCYNCDYFIKPHHCAIVTDEGQDIRGNVSDVIAPHAICSLWTPNEKEVR